MGIDGLKEFSTNFDLDDVKPFLEKISSKISSGFSQKEVDIVVRCIESLEPGGSYEQEFILVYNDQTMRMVISVYMSDYDAPDVYIFTPSELNEEIDKIWDED